MNADMTPERWAEIKGLLDVLLPLNRDSRDAVLCGLPPGLRHDLAQYLDVDPRLLGALPSTDIRERAPEVLAGRYRIERPLGRGGMGTVDLAHDLVLDCPVAVKRLRDPRLDDDEARRRLRNEGRALAALSHPHIARVQDVLDTSPPALVMEYVEGLPLDRWLHQPRTPVSVLAVVRDTVEAVGYAHGRGVVHCDLKPANVLVTRDGEAKVVDFGIARTASRSAETLTSDSTRAPAYTPRYAAPEVMRGATATPASDVYSLGVLIDEVVDTCSSMDHPLPPALALGLRRAASSAHVDGVSARPLDAAALLKVLPTSAAPLTPARRWKTLATTSFVLATACGTAGLSLTGDGGVRVSAQSMPVLAVVPRVDQASSPTVSAGAADLFRSALGHLTRARLVTGDVPPFRDDLSDLIAQLRDQGLSHVVIPTVASVGSGIRMSVVVYLARDGSVVKTFTRHGSSEAVGTLAGDVAGQVRAWLGEPSAAAPTTVRQFQPTPAALELFSQARQYSARPDVPGALARARALLESAIKAQPSYAAAHAELGRVLLMQYRETPDPGLMIKAQDALVDAQRDGADLEEVQLALATAKQMTGRRDEAVGYLHRVLDLDPENDRALKMLGAIEVAAGRAEAGLALLRRAADARPSFQNLRALGTALYEEGRYAEAVPAFERLALLQQDNPWSFQMIGAAHHQLGNRDRAAQAYERSIAVRRTASTLTNFATFLYQIDELARAEPLYVEAAEREPHDPVFWRNLGDCQLQRGRHQAARDTYGRAVSAAERLLAVDPGDVRALGNAAYASARQDNCDAARAYGDTLATLAPTQVSALANRANAHAICGRHADAVAILTPLAARGHGPSAILERDVWKMLSGRAEYRMPGSRELR